MADPRKTLYLCGGLQSSGTTLVSWCFLQRADMNGSLDADNDLLPAMDERLGSPCVWYKTTIGCFRLTELVAHYEDAGWRVRPLLVVRDVRDVWASLLGKPYARNGITAEDPPLRLRLRRFREDWETFVRLGWPMLRYESLLAEPVATLRGACAGLGLPWDAGMVGWPKRIGEIADARWGNGTFWRTQRGNLLDSLASHRERSERPMIGASDLQWLEEEFRQFNEENGYPISWGRHAGHADIESRAVPTFDVTRRYEWETKRKPLRWLLMRLGVPNRKLIDERSGKNAAA